VRTARRQPHRRARQPERTHSSLKHKDASTIRQMRRNQCKLYNYLYVVCVTSPNSPADDRPPTCHPYRMCQTFVVMRRCCPSWPLAIVVHVPRRPWFRSVRTAVAVEPGRRSSFSSNCHRTSRSSSVTSCSRNRSTGSCRSWGVEPRTTVLIVVMDNSIDAAANARNFGSSSMAKCAMALLAPSCRKYKAKRYENNAEDS
jgi:hypothetical protein